MSIGSRKSLGSKIFLAAMLALVVFATLGALWLGFAFSSKLGSETAGKILQEIYSAFGGEWGVYGILLGATAIPPLGVYVISKISTCCTGRAQLQQPRVAVDPTNLTKSCLTNSAGIETLAQLERVLAGSYGSWREKQPLIHSSPHSGCWPCCGRRSDEDTKTSQPSSSHSYTVN